MTQTIQRRSRISNVLTSAGNICRSMRWRYSLWILTAIALAASPFRAAAQNPDCTLIVPANPLSATGLATPYQLTATNPVNGPCDETLKTADGFVQAAFVQAAVIDMLTGQISIYNPLVINKGTAPAVNPVPPHLPLLNVVALWFGYNGGNLTLTSASPSTLTGNDCHQGMGQFAYCNAPAFFLAANTQILLGSLKVPPLGFGTDHRPCPTVRSFAVVDQDQSDNLPTTYLIAASGKVAQYTAANLIALPGAKVLGNPSDNRLTDVFLDGALGCTPWTAPDLANPGHPVPALPLNELQAAAYQGAPSALIPMNHPFALVPPVTGVPNLAKVNEYRAGVDQFPAIFSSDASTATYCSNLLSEATAKLVLDRVLFTAAASPFPNEANSLFTFMAMRLHDTWDNLTCSTFISVANPVSLTTNAMGVVTDAVIH